MKTFRIVLLNVAVLILLPPLFARAAKSTPAPGKALPSAHLRHMIDKTLAQIGPFPNAKSAANRTALTETQAEWSARAQTAPAAQQPTYTAAANLVQMLLSAEAEHDKAIADYRYSKKVHGAQDRQDLEISNAGQHSGTAFANNQKQNKENADNRKALLQKEEFMNKGAIENWKVRTEQIRTLIEQAYTEELVTEKQMVMARAAAPAPAAPPPPRPVKQPSAAEAYSPIGTWKAENGQWTLNEDGSFTTALGAKGTWHWSDPGKRELALKWAKGGEGKGAFAADGKSLELTMPKGGKVALTRGAGAGAGAGE